MTSIEEITHGETTLIDQLLAEQQSLTAVSSFSQKHAKTNEPIQSRYYRDLIPLNDPGEGEQYSFEVDLDACTGCKSCVTACNSLNGLDPDESWRDTHLLIGGTQESSRRQIITSACHHCDEPTCASGCPVLAYEKDPVTGIVRHLDDQCIGCQYCILTCAYDVPKYNSRLGIVRKCDMCQSRLAEGEAPACVQGCPNEAIQINIIKVDTIPAIGQMVPGAFDSSHSRPSTVYTRSKDLPADTIRDDAYDLTPQPGHSPLVWMLCLTQAAGGIFLFQLLLSKSQAFSNLSALPWMALAGLTLGGIGILSSIAHLGQPLKAWRSFLGLRHSWLSREIIAFGVWLPVAALYTISYWLQPQTLITSILGTSTVLSGLLSIYCSVMVYACTPRPFWAIHRTGIRFFGTALITGIAGTLALFSFSGLSTSNLALALGIAISGKVAFELSALLPMTTQAQWSPAKHTALLQWNPLRTRLIARLLLYICTLLTLPFVAAPLTASLVLISVFVGEFFARSLFFRSVSTNADSY